MLPAGYGYELGSLSREEASSGSTIVVIFIIIILFIYIILCALYESLFIPLAVMLSVPFGLMGSFLFAKMFGIENNVYMQTGLIMLIGLLAKTAILLTEYASARRRHGMSIAQAALSAAAVRLRPILMTALTMIIGLFPLVVATGAGANGNISLGVGTVGGMLIGTVALLFVVLGLVAGVPVIAQFAATGLVPKLPTALLAVGLVFVGLLCFACGLILDTVVKGNRKQYEIEVTEAYERARNAHR